MSISGSYLLFGVRNFNTFFYVLWYIKSFETVVYQVNCYTVLCGIFFLSMLLSVNKNAFTVPVSNCFFFLNWHVFFFISLNQSLSFGYRMDCQFDTKILKLFCFPQNIFKHLICRVTHLSIGVSGVRVNALW